MNYESQPLQRHEVEAMKADETIVERVLRSYRLMLDFYGMRLEDSETGLLARSDKNYKDRYKNLTRKSYATDCRDLTRPRRRFLAQLPPYLADT